MSNVQITFNSPAMASLYELLCYHSLDNSDPFMDDFLTFFQFTQPSLYFFSAIPTVLPEAADGNHNEL